MADIIPKITDEDFVEMFGCDKKTYDKMLCENEAKILKERDRIYENNKDIDPYSFIGKHLTYSNKTVNYKNVVISDIRITTDNPEHFETYYSIYTKSENGEEQLLIEVTIDEFIDGYGGLFS